MTKTKPTESPGFKGFGLRALKDFEANAQQEIEEYLEKVFANTSAVIYPCDEPEVRVSFDDSNLTTYFDLRTLLDEYVSAFRAQVAEHPQEKPTALEMANYFATLARRLSDV